MTPNQKKQQASELDALTQFASVRQLEYMDALRAHGTNRKASAALGINKRTLEKSLRSLRDKAAQMGHSPQHDMTHVVPDGFNVKGVSSYYNKDGKLTGQWVKTRADEERREELFREALEVLCTDVIKRAPLTKAPDRTKLDPDLLAVYPFGDPHFGLYSWAKESGDDFDLNAAQELTLGAVDRLVSCAPAADTAIVLPLGDIFHANDQSNQTPQHKHQLDVDTRFVKVIGVGIETFRHVIFRTLEKHNRVIVRFVGGNHDPQAMWALAYAISAYFCNEPRVEVDLSPAAHWFYRFGKVLIGSTHGDKSKSDQLPGVMACDAASDWGQTKHRYWLCGHVHNTSITEYPGVTVETFRTLAAADAYAAGYGYRAGRDMRCIVMHKDHGEIERHRCDIGMLTERRDQTKRVKK